MTVDDAIKIVTCCEFDHGLPGERALLAEAKALLEGVRQDRTTELRSLAYADYLQSDHWKAVSRAAIKRAEGKCQICYSPRKLQVHHRTYERVGCERDMDLTVLCADCHELYHIRADAMVERTRAAIEQAKRERAEAVPVPAEMKGMFK